MVRATQFSTMGGSVGDPWIWAYPYKYSIYLKEYNVPQSVVETYSSLHLSIE